MVTVALHMFVWHICTYTANQMTVQRYFSTVDVRAARRSFVVASLVGVGLNVLLMLVGMAVFYFYQVEPDLFPAAVNREVGKQSDQIFAYFVVERLPPGVAGCILAALLAATMSSIDSGINSTATVLTVEWRAVRQRRLLASETSDSVPPVEQDHVRLAQVLTILAGVSITLAAIGLDRLTGDWNIVDMMPRSFNCFTGAMGGLFLVGMFMRRARGRTALVASFCGLATSIAIAYSQELFGLETPISFTWIMPGSLAVTLLVAWFVSRFEPPPVPSAVGWTWYARSDHPDVAQANEPSSAQS
jgi:SSS family solute:Na+ symporter